jgi:hypothetical protein
MLAAGTSSRILFLALAFCIIDSTSTYPQEAAFFSGSKIHNHRTNSGTWPAKCEPSSTNTFAASGLNYGREWPAIADGVAGDSNVTTPDASCVEPAFSATPGARADNPCSQNVTRFPDVSGSFPCNELPNTVPAELSALGKAGLKIERAREKVLEILRSENACTEWFEAKDASPAVTFQSLNFSLDQNGQHNIFESKESESRFMLKQPYVARATQDGGAHTAITINAYGAFYRTQGQVQKISQEGLPLQLDGTRVLTVGSYSGNTLPAQMVTLLHEFGHIIDLLPEDADNLDGKSGRNTDEVLRHCRSEVEVRANRTGQPVAR